MGRKTWDSLPPRFRPLPGRRNIVVTRQPAWQSEGAERAGSLDAALALCRDVPLAWVIGGAELYALAAPRAHIAEVTLIDADYAGDAFAPTLGASWTECARSRHVAASGLAFEYITYQQAAA
jgi:dihydrofolate reductase